MARIFTISFVHEGHSYDAMVSERKTPFHTEYSLNMLDDGILRSLPGNKIVSQNEKHYAFLYSDAQNSTPLMEQIIKAIAEHVHSFQESR